MATKAPFYALALLALPLGGAGCAAFQKKDDKAPFETRRGPGGDFCSDMVVVFNGEPEPRRPFHRVKTVRTTMIETTAPERLQLLREVACDAKGDAVIDAGDYEGVAEGGKHVKFLAGTVIQWTTASNLDPTTVGGIKLAPRPAVSTATKEEEPAPAKADKVEKAGAKDEEADEEEAPKPKTKKKKKAASSEE